MRRILLLVLLLVLPGLAAGEDAASGLITHGSRAHKRVALTFDLCQTLQKPAGFDAPLIAILKEKQIAATFFAGGEWLKSHPQEARLLADTPFFELGNHSQTHPDLRQLDGVAIRTEIEQTEALLRELQGGRSSRLFRLPFGYYDPRVLREVAASGVRIIQWDVVSADPDPKVSAAAIVAEVKRKARNGSIIIMHANGRGRHTAEALPEVIRYLRGQGYELVTVSTLLQP